MAVRKTSGILALEFAPASLRYVELIPDLDPENQIVTAGVLALKPGQDAAALADLIRSALELTESMQPGMRGGTLVASVPYRHAFVRRLDLPEDDEDTADSVRWEMSQYLARPVDAYALDGQRDRVDGSTGTIAVAYRLTEIQTLRRAVEEAGAPAPAFLDLDALAVLHAFAVNYPECLPERTVILKVDDSATTLIRTRGGAYAGGSVVHESETPAAAGPHERAERLLVRARSVVKSLEALLGAAGGEWAEAERVFLCGDLSGNSDFRELLKTAMRAPFALLNPFRKVPGPNPDTHSATYPGAPFAAVVGLALRAASERAPKVTDEATPHLNLLRGIPTSKFQGNGRAKPRTPPTGSKTTTPSFTRVLVATAILIIAALAGMLLTHPEWIRQGRDRLTGLTSVVPVASAAKPDPAQAELEARASRLIAAEQAFTLNWLREMETALPFDSLAGVEILRTVFTQPDAFVVTGTARSAEILSTLQESLVLVPGLDLRRSEMRPAAPGPGTPRGSLEFLFSGGFTTDRDTTLPVSGRVLAASAVDSALHRFLASANERGIRFTVLPAQASTASGELSALPFRLRATCRPEPLREFLEIEATTHSPFGIQRVSLDNTGDSLAVFLDIMAFSH
jgi:Tfp pilus assembly PilM family ATPase